MDHSQLYRLYRLCVEGKLNDVKMLIEEDIDKQIDIHAHNEYAFSISCYFGQLEIVKYLISLKDKYGAIDIHIDDDYAFRISCANGYLKLAKYLISLRDEYGIIDIHAQCNYAFAYSYIHSYSDVVDYLKSLQDEYGEIYEVAPKYFITDVALPYYDSICKINIPLYMMDYYDECEQYRIEYLLYPHSHCEIMNYIEEYNKEYNKKPL